MNTTLLAAFAVFAPTCAFFKRSDASWRRATSGMRDSVAIALQAAPGRVKIGEPARSMRTASARRMPLRIVRVLETGQASAHTGRLMISGRMADVCAELDRMAEREANTPRTK